MEVIQGSFGKAAPNEPEGTRNPELSVRLRELADSNDRNEVDGLVFCAIENSEHVFYISANLYLSIALSAMLNKVILDHFTDVSSTL